MRNAMIIDGKDNVVVAIEPISKGDTVTYLCDGARTVPSLLWRISSSITSWLPAILPRANRWSSTVSISALPPSDIRAGEHVHVHNVEGHRENLEEKE